MHPETKTASTSTTEEDERAAAIRRIRRLVDDAQAAQSDVEPFLALHTPDVVLVNIAGRRVLGGDVLRRAMEEALTTHLAHFVTTAEVQDIRFVRPDVAVVSCAKHVVDDRDAEAGIVKEGSLTYVVVEEGGGWRIALAQTTPLVTAAV